MESQRDKAVSSTFLKLLQHLFPSTSAKNLHQQHQYGLRLLGSRIPNPSIDQTSAKHKILSFVTHCNADKADSRASVQVQDLLTRLSRMKGVQKRAQILHLLLKIAQGKKTSEPFHESLFKQQSFDTRASSFIQSPTNRTQLNLSSVQLVKVRQKASTQCGLSQEYILSQILFVLQNVQCHLISLQQDAFRVKPVQPVSEPSRKMIAYICELGWIFRSICEIIMKFDEGLVRKAFNQGVKLQLTEYFRWIAVMEGLLRNGQLSLRKMMVWAGQPLQRLKWILIICQAVKHFSGAKIISIVNSFRPQGDDHVNSLVNRLLFATLRPFLRWVELWITKGQTLYKENQFFIIQNGQQLEHRLWALKYELDDQLIPNVITKQLAILIFRAGKSINFLKACCQQQYCFQSAQLNLQEVLTTDVSQSTKYLPTYFSSWVYNAVQQANRQLLRVLFDKYKLLMHLNAIKQFLLMGLGDFILTLINNSHSELNKPVRQVYKPTLKGMLQDAIKSSNAQYQPQQVQHRLSFQISKDNLISNFGWDNFYLIYRVDRPVNTILTPQAFDRYHQIFKLLWQVKILQNSLNKLWKDHKKLGSLPSQIRNRFHKCQLARHDMSKFVSTLSSYIMLAVEQSWSKFMQKAKQAKQLQDILKEHQQFLWQVIQKLLLSYKTKEAKCTLDSIFQTLRKFKINQERVNSSLYSELKRIKQVHADREALLSLGRTYQLQSFDFSELEQHGFDTAEQEHFNFVEAVTKFNRQAQLLDLKHLYIQIDFNQYYSFRSQVKAI